MNSTRLHLFQAYGIELEYMIVDKDSLAIKPITDELFKKETGSYCSDVEKGEVTWCNELVLHVLELKCTTPTNNLVKLNSEFQKNINYINNQLKAFNSKLLPTAAHPMMDPHKETFLWPHDNNEVYNRYNKIFNCKGHGWSNLQSMHINLPFYDDEEFALLHAAIRLVLPILPALAASSPMLGGIDTGYLDKRMDYYQKNQKIIPSLTGKVIPERAFSKRQYHKFIYDRIDADTLKYNEDKLLQPVWLNSRGAIARFDRGSIEIRVLDLQECPNADLAIATLIICVLKTLVAEKNISIHDQQSWAVDDLYEILNVCIINGEKAVISNSDYLRIFDFHKETATSQELWKHIITRINESYPEEMAPWLEQLNTIINHGTLASRILKALGGIYTPENTGMIYSELADCLSNNEMFEVCLKEPS